MVRDPESITAWENLSAAGRSRRLHGLALAALAQYELAEPRLTFHAFATNLFYRVRTGSGEEYMLRLAAPGWRTLEDLRSEALWLAALSRDTTLAVPRIQPSRNGELVLPISRPGIPQVWNATLMSRVPGRLLGRYLTSRNLEKMGRLFAELHAHAAQWTPPPGFTTRRFEHWLSRGEANRIIGDGAGNPSNPIPAQARPLLERMHCHVEEAYASLDRRDLRVIHCDLWQDNIKIHKGVLHPFDFEDTIWGFRIHDIAMSMLDLLETVGPERYPALLQAFRGGYETLLAWPEGCLEPFQVGRLLWKINWVARNQPQWLEGMVGRYIPVFECYEQTGKVVLAEG